MSSGSSGFESFKRSVSDKEVKKQITRGQQEYKQNLKTTKVQEDGLTLEPTSPPLLVEIPEYTETATTAQKDRWIGLVYEEANEIGGRHRLYDALTSAKPEWADELSEVSTEKKEKKKPEWHEKHLPTPEERFQNIFGREPDKGAVTDWMALDLLQNRSKDIESRYKKHQEEYNLQPNESMINECIQAQLEAGMESGFKDVYRHLENIRKIKELTGVEIGVGFNAKALQERFNAAIDESASVPGDRTYDRVGSYLLQYLELVEHDAGIKLNISRQQIDAVITRDLKLMATLAVPSSERFGFSDWHSGRDSIIQTWNKFAADYGPPSYQVVDETYVKLFQDETFRERIRSPIGRSFFGSMEFLQLFRGHPPTIKELTEVGQRRGLIEKDKSIADVLNEVCRESILYGDPYVAQEIEKMFGIEFKPNAEEVQAMYARILFDQNEHWTNSNGWAQNSGKPERMQDFYDWMVLRTGVTPEMDIIDNRYKEFFYADKSFQEFKDIIKVPPNDSFSSRLYGDILKYYVLQTLEWEDEGVTDNDLFKINIDNLNNLKKLTEQEVKFDPDLFTDLIKTCIEKGNIEDKLPNLAGIAIEHNQLPPILTNLMQNWELGTKEELVSFLKENSTYARLLFEHPEQLPSLTKSDADMAKSLHLKLDELEFIKRSGRDLAQLAKTGNSQEAFNALTETHPDWKPTDEITEVFKQSAEIFGYDKIFLYIDRKGLLKRDALSSFNNIIEMYRGSGLTATQFYDNILGQIVADINEYDGFSPQKLFNNMFMKYRPNPASSLETAKNYPDIERLQQFVQEFDSTDAVFSSWKSLKSFCDYDTFLAKVENVEQSIDQYPKNSSVTKLIRMFETPQVGDRLLYSLQGLHNLDFNRQVEPIIAAQGSSAFLYFDQIRKIPNLYELSNEDTDYIVRVAKKYGTQARNILENLLTHVPSISEEAPMIDAFIDEIGIVDLGLYKQFKLLKDANDTDGLRELKESLTELQNKIYNGTMNEKDFQDRLYPAVSYYTFPPAVGITQEQYLHLNSERQDRSDDIPEELTDLQYTDFAVRIGKYTLGEDKELKLENWELLSDVVKKVNKEFDQTQSVKIDEDETAKKLIAMFKTKGSSNAEDRRYLFESMYRYNLAHEGGKLDTGYDLSLPGLMKYKEFVGEQMKNNLIRDCLEKYKDSHPTEFDVLKMDIMNRLKKQQQQSIGMVKSMLTGIRRQTNDDERAKAIGRLDDFLRNYNLSYEGVKDRPFDEYSKDLLVAEEQDTDSLVIQKISSDLVAGINKDMRKEVEKFGFTPESEGEAVTRQFQFVISKKREHGVAGYNMGVCVTPDQQLWEDPGFMNLVIFDPKTKQAMGGIHLLIREGNLTLPGINPSLDVLATVNNEELYQQIIKFTQQVKEKLGLQKLLIPTAPIIHSNRTQIQEIIREKNYDKYRFDKTQPFSYYPYKYSFEEVFEVN